MSAETIHRHTRGEPERFESIFREYFVPLVSFAAGFVKDTDAAREIVQNLFVKVWEKRNELDMDSPMKSYLFTATHRSCLNHLRDLKKFDREKQPGLGPDTPQYSMHDDPGEAEEVRLRVHKALQALPEKCREVFLFSRFEDMGYKEIAWKLNISVKTVETHMSKALMILREDLKDLTRVLVMILLIMREQIIRFLSG